MKMTLTQAYAAFGLKPKNIQWSWTARNDDRVAALTWQDHYASISEYRFPALDEETRSRHGFKEMIANLKWALEHKDGVVNILIARSKPRDGDEFYNRRIVNVVPRKDLVMKTKDLDETTGSYTGIILPVVAYEAGKQR